MGQSVLVSPLRTLQRIKRSETMKIVAALLALAAVTAAAPAPQASNVVATVTGGTSGNGLQFVGGAALASNQQVAHNNIRIEHSHAQAQNLNIAIQGPPGFNRFGNQG